MQVKAVSDLAPGTIQHRVNYRQCPKHKEREAKLTYVSAAFPDPYETKIKEREESVRKDVNGVFTKVEAALKEKASTKDLEALKKKEEALEVRVSTLTKQVEDEKAARKQEKEELEKRIKALELSGTASNVDAFMKQSLDFFTKMGGQMQELVNRVESLDSRVVDLGKKLQVVEKDVAALK